MKRALFTVVVRGPNGLETGYCANHLNTYDGQSGQQALAFISSGRLVTVPVKDIVEVKLGDGWGHCNACDGPISHISYFADETARTQA